MRCILLVLVASFRWDCSGSAWFPFDLWQTYFGFSFGTWLHIKHQTSNPQPYQVESDNSQIFYHFFRLRIPNHLKIEYTFDFIDEGGRQKRNNQPIGWQLRKYWWCLEGRDKKKSRGIISIWYMYFHINYSLRSILEKKNFEFYRIICNTFSLNKYILSTNWLRKISILFYRFKTQVTWNQLFVFVPFAFCFSS